MKKKKIKKDYKFGGNISPEMMGGISNGLSSLSSGLENIVPKENISETGKKVSKGFETAENAAINMGGPWGMLAGGITKGLRLLTTGFINKNREDAQDPRNDIKLNSSMNNMTSNPYGTQFKMGGKFYQLGGTKVSEFDAPTHNQGGMNIDENMNPTNMNSKGEIEKKEVGVGNYIFSDFLKDSDGKTFAEKAKKITRKYKGREDSISLTSMDKELSLLSKRNDSLKQTQEPNKFEGGGDFLTGTINDPDFMLKNFTGKEPEIFGKKPVKSTYPMSPFPNTFSNVDYTPDPNATFKTPNKTTDFMSPSFDTFSKGPEVDPKTTMPVNGVTPPSKEKLFNEENTDKTLSGLVYGIKGLQTIGHAAQAFQKPDYIDPVLNPNASKIKSLASNRKIDLQSVLNEIRLDENKGIKDISDNSLSDSVRRSNIANTISNTQRAVADTKLKEQAMNMDFRKDEMVALDSLGQQDVAARVYSEDANAKTKANMQVQRSKFLQETVGGMGDYIAKKDYANKSDAFYTNLLNQKYEDFGVSDPKDFTKEHAEIIRYKLAKGEDYDQIIKEYKTLTGDFKPKE